MAVLALVFAVRTFEDQPAQDRTAPWDLIAAGRVFALIELLRGVTVFLIAPILLFLATAIGASRAGPR